MTHKAQKFAIDAHGSQLYGVGRPYADHLHDVVSFVGQTRDPVLHPHFLEDVAWLHDVLEDTAVTADELEERFGSFVTRSVQMITDPFDATNRRQKKAIVNNRLQLMGVDDITERASLIVKTADRLANIRYAQLNSDRDKLAMYRKEHAAFKTAALRDDLLPSWWDRMDFELGLIPTGNT